jgi:hypothetical protein
MAAGALQSLKRTSRDATGAIASRAESATSQMTTTEVVVTVVGVAALIGFVTAAIYYTPDLIRYIKIERM